MKSRKKVKIGLITSTFTTDDKEDTDNHFIKNIFILYPHIGMNLILLHAFKHFRRFLNSQHSNMLDDNFVITKMYVL